MGFFASTESTYAIRTTINIEIPGELGAKLGNTRSKVRLNSKLPLIGEVARSVDRVIITESSEKRMRIE